MRQVIWIAAFLMLLPVAGRAQETPKIEVFGGYSFLRPEGGGFSNGWQASVAANVNDWFGVVAEFSGHYDSDDFRMVINRSGFPSFIAESEVDTSLHSFLFGLRFSHRKHERITPFAHALVGVARRHQRGTVNISDPDLDDLFTDFSFTDSNFAAALGGGVDVKLNRRFALRLVQADYLPVRNDSFTLDNVRISSGLVIRF